MNYQESLNHIYSTYMYIKPDIKGKPDSQVRNVDIILSIAKQLNIVPKKQKIIKITGSKGKGTTTRLCETMIRSHFPDKNVAMLISPEEIEHYDRMRVNDTPITPAHFAEIYTNLLPVLTKKSNTFKGLEYLSPSGLFLLIALVWFDEQDIDYYAFETGRGAQFDEVGNIDSRVSIVSSILLEHPQYLGDSIESIAKHKLFACVNSDYAILGNSAKKYYSDQYTAICLEQHAIDNIDTFPSWYNDNMSLALTGVAKLCNANAEGILLSFINADAHTSASFGYKRIEGQNYYYDSAITANSLDRKFLSTIANASPNKGDISFVVSLPDEKDITGLVDTLKTYGAVKHITLTGTRGYLSYDITSTRYTDCIIWSGQYDDVDGFATAIKTVKSETVYLLGTQTYIRLVKKALFDYKYRTFTKNKPI